MQLERTRWATTGTTREWYGIWQTFSIIFVLNKAVSLLKWLWNHCFPLQKSTNPAVAVAAAVNAAYPTAILPQTAVSLVFLNVLHPV